MREELTLLEELVAGVFANSTQKKYWEHTKRVSAYAQSIGKAEGADLDVLLPAVLLHDIGMTVDAGFPSHVEKSELLGGFMLRGLGYGEAEAQRIVGVVASHHPQPGEMLNSLEEKALYDADLLDIVGVFGVLRWIGAFPPTTKELVASIDLFLSIVDRCVAARGSLFFTETARRMADKTVDATVDYYKKVKQHVAQFELHPNEPFPISF